MIRKIGVLAAALAIAGSAMAARIEGKETRDTKDSGVWLPIGLSLIAYPMQVPTVEHSIYGVMLNAGYGKMDNVYPLEAGLFNQVLGNMGGVQAGVSNLAEDLYGFQLGIVNISTAARGFQIGLVNVTDHLYGLQVGLVNVNKAGTVFFPVINLGF